VPSSEFISPVIDFPIDDQVVSVENTLQDFFSDLVDLPDNYSRVMAKSFILRSTALLKITKSFDLDLSSPEIDIAIRIASDDGNYLTIGNQYIGQSYDMNFIWNTPDAYNLINIFAQITNSLIIRPEYDSKYIRIEVTGKDDGEGNSSMIKTVYSSFIYIGGIQSGDINGDGKLDIKDCIITAQLLTNINSIGIISGADINKNNKIGMEEFIYLLMSVSGSK